MNVNQILSKVNRLNKSALALGIAGSILLLAAVILVLPTSSHPPLPPNRVNLIIRQIGHQLLLQSGDSSSRVLPVKTKAGDVYELRFEREFGFMPDSLLLVIKQNMADFGMTTPYEVSVQACSTEEVVYGFEIVPQPPQNRPDYKEIVPCLGREQPKACYVVQIRLQAAVDSPRGKIIPLALSIGGLLCFFLAWWRSRLKNQHSLGMHHPIIPIGGFDYVPARQLLLFQQQMIPLSDKENQVLGLLASRPAELVSREELLKKVWEDEGVITGRSLDVFISKLRKKLLPDPKVQLNNVHGRGYKLEILP